MLAVRPNIVIKNTDMSDLIRGNTAQRFASQTTSHHVTIESHYQLQISRSIKNMVKATGNPPCKVYDICKKCQPRVEHPTGKLEDAYEGPTRPTTQSGA